MTLITTMCLRNWEAGFLQGNTVLLRRCSATHLISWGNYLAQQERDEGSQAQKHYHLKVGGITTGHEKAKTVKLALERQLGDHQDQLQP